MIGAYGLVLGAMAQGGPVSLVVAFRQLSLPIGAVIGIRCFDEPSPWSKRIGIGLTCCGLVAVAW